MPVRASRGLGMPPLLRQFPTGTSFPLFAGPWGIPVPKLKSRPRFSLVWTALLCGYEDDLSIVRISVLG